MARYPCGGLWKRRKYGKTEREVMTGRFPCSSENGGGISFHVIKKDLRGKKDETES